MLSNKRKLAAAAAVLLMVAAGCSSSKSTSSSSSAASGTSGAAPSGGTYTIGILTDVTGLAASGNKTTALGAQVGAAALAAPAGYSLKFVVGDTESSPGGALSAAQKLVEQGHVLAVIAVSSLTFSAASYLTSQGIPVVGLGEDGPEWVTANNMFSAFGALDTTRVSTTFGQVLKRLGATDVGALGYGISPTSAESAKGDAASAQAAGIKVGYVNAQFAFGSTNVEPIALAMEAAHIDAFTASVDGNTAFALITALRQGGVKLKVPILATGYGGDILTAGPGAIQAAQGVYFLVSFEPIEMHTAATDEFESALKSAGITIDPTFAEYGGYASVALLVDGLKAAGPNPSRAALISALSGIKSFDAAGLLGSRTLDMTNRAAQASTTCFWLTQLSGTTFRLISGAEPVCGSAIPGKTVSASS